MALTLVKVTDQFYLLIISWIELDSGDHHSVDTDHCDHPHLPLHLEQAGVPGPLPAPSPLSQHDNQCL